MDIQEKFALNTNYLRWLRWKPRIRLGLVGSFELEIKRFLECQVEQIVCLDDNEDHNYDVSCFLVNHKDEDIDSLNIKLDSLDYDKASLALACINGDAVGRRSSSDSDTNIITLDKLKDYFDKEKLHYRIYYIYPDFNRCKYLFSDEFLPNSDMISIHQWNEQDEDARETEMLKDALVSGRFSRAVRGYLCLAWRDYFAWQFNLPRLVKFSNMRKKTIAVYTSLVNDEVWKTAAWPEGQLHINRYVEHAIYLRNQYQEAQIDIGDCRREGCSAVSCFAQGVSLRDIMDELYEKNDEKFFVYVDDYIHRVQLANSNGYFDYSNDFREVFGRPALPIGLRSGTYVNLDLVFDNIIINDKGDWSMIDHEWTIEFPVPNGFIIFRAIFYYFQTRPETEQKERWKALCWRMSGMNKSLVDTYYEMEKKFQAWTYK